MQFSIPTCGVSFSGSNDKKDEATTKPLFGATNEGFRFGGTSDTKPTLSASKTEPMNADDNDFNSSKPVMSKSNTFSWGNTSSFSNGNNNQNTSTNAGNASFSWPNNNKQSSASASAPSSFGNPSSTSGFTFNPNNNNNSGANTSFSTNFGSTGNGNNWSKGANKPSDNNGSSFS